MSKPHEKLAESLELLRKLQASGFIAIQTSDLSRTHRARLVKNGFLQEVMKGWYIPSRIDESPGESTAWYASFWSFCAAYLDKRFGNDWCLSPEQSISLLAGNWTVPKQLLVRSSKGRNKITNLVHQTSLFDTRYAMPDQKDIIIIDGIKIYTLAAALVVCSSQYFSQHASDIRAALISINDSSDILRILLAGGHSTIAGRLAGAFIDVGNNEIADDIIKTMTAAGYVIRPENPFSDKTIIHLTNARSPQINRMHILWEKMRQDVLLHFPKPSKNKINLKDYIKVVDDTYVTDAYHSLSIEGYRVNEKLIEQVKSGKWNPEGNHNDKEQTSALAARGYWQAFNAVKKSISRVFRNDNPGEVFKQDHRDWYREMFSPSVIAGIIKPEDLAGYRNEPVYIRKSMHVPPNASAVRDLMPAFCELLINESDPAVRVVLGHFFFVYIHPYIDGNGRIGRFLMNFMLAAGGYPWIVVPVTSRDEYISALEEASTNENIVPFVKFIAELVKDRVQGKKLPSIK